MQEELTALARNQTWTLVPRPPNINVIGARWVFKVKQRADGSLERYKLALLLKVSIRDLVLIVVTLTVLW